MPDIYNLYAVGGIIGLFALAIGAGLLCQKYPRTFGIAFWLVALYVCTIPLAELLRKAHQPQPTEATHDE